MNDSTTSKTAKPAEKSEAENVRLDRLARSLEREADNMEKEARNRADRLREMGVSLRAHHQSTEQALRVLALIKDVTK